MDNKDANDSDEEEFVSRQSFEVPPGLFSDKSTPNSTFKRLMVSEKEAIKVQEVNHAQFQQERAAARAKFMEQVKNDLVVLAAGSKLLKIPHRGTPKLTTMFVHQEGDNYVLSWHSKTKGKSKTSFILKDCKLYLGQGQGLFKKRNITIDGDLSTHSRMSFSLVTSTRTIDLMAQDSDSYDRWLRIFRFCGVQSMK